MKCNNCKSEWIVDPGLSVSMTNCPFCGKSLLSEKKKLSTVEDVLVEINKRFGVNILIDKTKLIAYFSDLAPQLSKQRRLLRYFVECDGPQKLVNVMGSSEDKQSICIKQIVKEMKDEMFIEECASRMICDSFLFAISGHRLTEITPPTQTQNNISSVSTTIKQEVVVTELTAEEQYQKGNEYYSGTNTVSKDYQRAFEWFQKAALRGHPMAQCILGLMYQEGHGIPKDEKKAFVWYKKSANQDYIPAQTKVGNCYALGYGVERDPVEAKKWFQKAADQGDEIARAHFNKLNRKGLTEENINALIKKYQLEKRYYAAGTPKFIRKAPMAANAYAFAALEEEPLLMEDSTILGSAKEGFILTQKTLFYNDPIRKRKGKYLFERIKSVSLLPGKLNYVDLKIDTARGDGSVTHFIACTTDRDEAVRIMVFWKELLELKHSLN